MKDKEPHKLEDCRLIDFIRLVDAQNARSMHVAANRREQLGEIVSPTSYSRSVKALEESTGGCSLATRDRSGFQATPEGEQLITIFNSFWEKLQDFRQAANGPQQKITILAGDSITRWLLLPVIKQINAALAENQFIRITTATSLQAISGVDKETAQFGICRTDIAPRSFIKKGALGKSGYALICSQEMAAKHNLNLRKNSQVSGARLKKLLLDYPIATIGSSGQLAKSIREGISEYSKDQSRPEHHRGHLEFTHFEHVICAAQQDDILGIIPIFHALQYRDRIAWSPIKKLICGYSRELSLIYDKKKIGKLGPFADALHSILKARMDILQADSLKK